MKLAGACAVAGSQERVFALLQDPEVLARCMPGCERLEKTGEDEYAMRMKLILASISGLFDGKVKIADSCPPLSFRLIVEGSGKIGFLKGEGVLTVEPAEGTSVRYEGEVQVGGTIANVGQRLIDGTARMLIRRFFDKLGQEASDGADAAVGSTGP